MVTISDHPWLNYETIVTESGDLIPELERNPVS